MHGWTPHTHKLMPHTRMDAPLQVRGLPEVRLEEHDGVHSAPLQAQHAARVHSADGGRGP